MSVASPLPDDRLPPRVTVPTLTSMCAIRAYRLHAMNAEMTNRVRTVVALSVLPLLVLVASTLLHLGIFRHSILRALIHITLLAVLLYGLIALFDRFRPIRAFIGFVIATEIFVRLSYGSSVSLTVVMSILSTSPGETLSFFQLHLTEALLFVIFVAGMTLLKVAPWQSVNNAALVTGVAYLVLPMLLSVGSLFSSSEYENFRQTGRARGAQSELDTKLEYLIFDMSGRFPPLNMYRAVADAVRFSSIGDGTSSSWTDVSLQTESPALLVIGIGESLRANNLSLYSYKRNTTPLLSGMVSDLDVYTTAYSAGTNTWGSIPAMLTKFDSRPDISKSIVHLASDAGLETYWLSNQTKYTYSDFSVTTIAEQSDHVYFSADEGRENYYDEILLSKLEEIVESDGDNAGHRLIVLHFSGSHFRFRDRYPPAFAKFGDGTNRLDRYDNSILYTDHIQAKILELVKRNGGKYLFFADHGLGHPDGDFPLKHARVDPDMDSLKVPFFTTPDEKLRRKLKRAVSLFYFECIFSEWSGISAKELEDERYCENSLGESRVTYLDANLQLRTKASESLQPQAVN